MMSEFNFRSQIATSRVQSEKLLSLGLKKETADMTIHLKEDCKNRWYVTAEPFYEWEDDLNTLPCLEEPEKILPAWSLHRLLSMLPRYVRKEYIDFGRKYIAALDLIIDEDLCIGYKEGVDEPCYDKIFYAKDIYSSLCDCIEWLIKQGYFNKEYLV